jgi:hypothetical protein
VCVSGCMCASVCVCRHHAGAQTEYEVTQTLASRYWRTNAHTTPQPPRQVVVVAHGRVGTPSTQADASDARVKVVVGKQRFLRIKRPRGRRHLRVRGLSPVAVILVARSPRTAERAHAIITHTTAHHAHAPRRSPDAHAAASADVTILAADGAIATAPRHVPVHAFGWADSHGCRHRLATTSRQRTQPRGGSTSSARRRNVSRRTRTAAAGGPGLCERQ